MSKKEKNKVLKQEKNKKDNLNNTAKELDEDMLNNVSGGSFADALLIWKLFHSKK